MKYTTRSLLILVTVVAIMIATLRVPSERSVVALLVCVGAILIATARAYFRSAAQTRRVFGAAALTGFGYLFFYVATDSLIEIWINNLLIIPFAVMKAGPDLTMPDGGELGELLRTMEFQYFQQKMHLLLAVILGFTAGLLMAYRQTTGVTGDPQA